jgi:hypothetical protein
LFGYPSTHLAGSRSAVGVYSDCKAANLMKQTGFPGRSTDWGERQQRP